MVVYFSARNTQTLGVFSPCTQVISLLYRQASFLQVSATEVSKNCLISIPWELQLHT